MNRQNATEEIIRVLKSLLENRIALIGILLLIGAVFCALFAPVIVPHDPTQQDLRNILRPPRWIHSDKPNTEYFLGTDQLGRDILSQIIYGTRVSLFLAFSAVLISMVGGTVLGLIAAFYGGWIDNAISRLIEVQLSIPYVLLAVVVILTIGTSIPAIIGVLAIREWPLYARIVRGRVLSIKEEGYIASARAIGVSTTRLLFRHILPNSTNIIIVMTTLEIANVVLLGAGLSFLGLGVQPPTPSWGRMLANGRNYVWSAWWIATFPGIAISLVALSANVVGDWLSVIIDPAQRRA